MSSDGITLPSWTMLIPKDIPGWYWVMRKGMWPKCIRCVMGAEVIRPFDQRDGLRMEDFNHFIGPCAEPEPAETKNLYAGQKLFKPVVFKDEHRCIPSIAGQVIKHPSAHPNANRKAKRVRKT